MRWGCFVREVGKSIPRLPFEDDIFGPLDKPQELSPEIAKTVRIARDTLLQWLTEHPHSSVSEVCARKGGIVVQCDPGAKVDLAIGEALIGSGGEELIVQHIMKCMPGADSLLTLEHSQQLLEQTKEKGIVKFVSKRAQALLQATLDAVAGMRSGTAPMQSAFQDPPHRQSVVALPLLRHLHAEGQERRRERFGRRRRAQGGVI